MCVASSSGDPSWTPCFAEEILPCGAPVNDVLGNYNYCTANKHLKLLHCEKTTVRAINEEHVELKGWKSLLGVPFWVLYIECWFPKRTFVVDHSVVLNIKMNISDTIITLICHGANKKHVNFFFKTPILLLQVCWKKSQTVVCSWQKHYYNTVTLRKKWDCS